MGHSPDFLFDFFPFVDFFAFVIVLPFAVFETTVIALDSDVVTSGVALFVVMILFDFVKYYGDRKSVV